MCEFCQNGYSSVSYQNFKFCPHCGQVLDKEGKINYGANPKYIAYYYDPIEGEQHSELFGVFTTKEQADKTISDVRNSPNASQYVEEYLGVTKLYENMSYVNSESEKLY